MLCNRSIITFVSLAFGLSMSACGGSNDSGLGMGSGGQAGFGSGGTASGGSGGSAAGGSSGAGGGGVDDRIDPISLGHAWTYDVTISGTYPLCKAGSHTGQVLGQKEVGGKLAFQVQSLCPAAGVSSYFVDGDRVEVYYAGAWLLALDEPVQEGHTWSNGASTFTWHDLGTQTVLAGTFDDCFEARENVGHESYTVFCRGVGPIVWHNVDAGNGFHAELTSKNF